MTSALFSIRPIKPADDPNIEMLHAFAFGPGRFARTAYRLREGVAADPALSFVATAGPEIIGSVWMTPIRIGTRAALLLGPLAVRPDWTGKGAGKALVRMALDAARGTGHQVVLLVGDLPYYGPLGFERLTPNAITLPGPVDPARVLVAPLTPNALEGLSGAAVKWV